MSSLSKSIELIESVTELVGRRTDMIVASQSPLSFGGFAGVGGEDPMTGGGVLEDPFPLSRNFQWGGVSACLALQDPAGRCHSLPRLLHFLSSSCAALIAFAVLFCVLSRLSLVCALGSGGLNAPPIDLFASPRVLVSGCLS